MSASASLDQLRLGTGIPASGGHRYVSTSTLPDLHAALTEVRDDMRTTIRRSLDRSRDRSRQR